MNRIVYVWVALLFMALVACSRQEVEVEQPLPQEEPELVKLTVTATLGDESDTKTAVQSNGTSIYWTPGDAINLFYGNRSAGQFTSNITEPVQTADFSGTLSVATGSTEAGMEALAFWGVYPYNENNTCDGTGVTLTIPGTQQGVPGTFADKLNPTVATSPGLGLAFYNVGSWFLFSVTASDIASATLKGNNDEDLAGKVRVTMDGNGHPVTSVVEGIQSITITPATGDAFVPGELYYIVLRPQTLSGGYTLTMTKTSGASADCVVAKEAEFERSSYRRKRDADDGLVFKIPEPEPVDLGLSVKWASFNLGASSPEGYGDYYAWGETEPYYEPGYAQSNNPIWKSGKTTGYTWTSYRWCDGSNDSLTKYNNASSLGTVDNKMILELEDDAAFISWGGNWRMPTDAEWTELRDNCTWTWETINNSNGYKVTSNKTGYTDKWIFLPAAGYRYINSFSGLGVYADYLSSSLSDGYCAWVLASDASEVSRMAVYRIYGYAIRAVMGTSLNTPQSSNEIWYTSSTGDVVTPYGSQNIDATIVSNTYSNGLGKIVFDVPPTVIGNGSFANCTDLVSISLPNSVTLIGDSVFRNCTSLVSATLPNNVTSLGVVAFDGCTSLEKIVIPDSVQELGESCFRDCSSLVKVRMPASLSSISMYCFDGCSSLFDISIPSNVNKIEQGAFRGCVSLPTLFTIPENVWYIGHSAFANCTSLSKVYILRETGATIETSAFYMCPCYLYVPSVSLVRYSSSARTGTLYPFNKICSFDAEYIEPVDLGLSIKWAPVNVGSTTPTDGGGQFAWGEITTKEEYVLSNYKWYDYDNAVYTQYTSVSRNALNGTPDNIVNLYYWDDAARMNWGSDWRMPSLTEIEELVRECVWTPVWKPNYEGILLYMQVTGPNGNSIILPTGAAFSGYYLSKDLVKIGQYDNSNVYGLAFYPDEDYDYINYLGAYQCIRSGHANRGYFVRPVYEKL